VELDETRRTRVSPRVGGWIQELHVDSVGHAVKKGDPLFTWYSPDLLATQTDYLQALKTGHPAVIAAARRRLELWDIGAAQLDEIARTGQARDTMVLLAPADGVVMKKDAVQGQAFSPGEALFEIADLTHLWVHASLYEQDVPRLQVGQQAVVELSYVHRNFDARVSFIYPAVDALARTVEVRLEVENPDLALKPGMWATVEIEQDLGNVLAAPASAILQTGRRSVAFVDRDDGHLEPRAVTIGGRSDDYWEIRAGLQEGERVVTRALFLVDSESQLKAAIAGLATGSGDQP
jgi:Cu(I)/Ag(I) efflux system membrane fusion protein